MSGQRNDPLRGEELIMSSPAKGLLPTSGVSHLLALLLVLPVILPVG